MVKVSFENNKNWASCKCLVRKSEKMYLSQNVSKIWDVEFQKWRFLCSYVPEVHIYLSLDGTTHFQVVRSQKVLGCVCHMQKKTES